MSTLASFSRPECLREHSTASGFAQEARGERLVDTAEICIREASAPSLRDNFFSVQEPALPTVDEVEVRIVEVTVEVVSIEIRQTPAPLSLRDVNEQRVVSWTPEESAASKEMPGATRGASPHRPPSDRTQQMIDPRVTDPWVLTIVENRELHWCLHLLLFLALLVLVGGLLACVGACFAYSLALTASRADCPQDMFIFGLICSISTCWSIVQYALLAIQTTGHATLTQHFCACKNYWMCILGPILIGWSLAYISKLMWPFANIFFHTLLILVPSIATGVVAKAFCKLRYVARSCESGVLGGPRDCLYSKAMRGRDFGQVPSCPFTGITVPLVLRHATKPFLCFGWTALCLTTFRLLILASQTLPGGLDGWRQRTALVLIYVCSYMCEEGGGDILMRHMDNGFSILSYTSRMVVALYFVFDVVSQSFVNLAIVSADQELRLVLSVARPVMEACLRMRFALEYKALCAKLQKMAELSEYGASYLQQDARAMRRLIRVGSGLLVNVLAPALVSACACLFDTEAGLAMHAQCNGNLVPQAVEMVGPGVISEGVIRNNQVSFFFPPRLPLAQKR
eukprot:TRINITY_DN17305_c0_g1_i2.p1 TRINITY_DN17305_c0_g1~~TRINITY_DN17305_c0_g1_i2.p1  ORF type:complete len:570 (+),score=60.54 TRINITY_DN17305_c0_g1_i2:165-1874(+)